MGEEAELGRNRATAVREYHRHRISISPLDHPTLAPALQLLAVWHRFRADGGLPLRTDIGLAHVAGLVANLIILEPVDATGDWRYRLFGSALAERYGVDETGKRVRDIFAPDSAAQMLEDYRQTIESRAPAVTLARHQIWDHIQGDYARQHLLAERLLLPIIGRDGRTPWILMGLFFRN